MVLLMFEAGMLVHVSVCVCDWGFWDITCHSPILSLFHPVKPCPLFDTKRWWQWVNSTKFAWPISFIDFAKSNVRLALLSSHGAYMFAECTNLVLEVLDSVSCMEVDVNQPLVTPSLLLVYVAITKWMMLQQHQIVNRLGYIPQVRNEYARMIWNSTFRRTYARTSAVQLRSSHCKNSSFWVNEKWVGDALDTGDAVLVKSPKVIKSNVGLGVGCFEWVHDKHVQGRVDEEYSHKDSKGKGKGKGKEKDCHLGKVVREVFFAKKDKKEWRHVTLRVPKRYHTIKGFEFATFIMDNVRGHLQDLLVEVNVPLSGCSPCVSAIVLKPEFHKPFLLPLSFKRNAFSYPLLGGE